MDYNEALQDLENGKITACMDFFKKNNYKLEFAYSLLLSGRLDEAMDAFKQIYSLRSDWAQKIIPIMHGQIVNMPTYFQIRNFLEIDINLLLKSSQKKYAEYIIGAADEFQKINSETYKFLGRVLLKNGYLKASKLFLDKATDVCYKDVELRFLYVEHCLMNNDVENAMSALDKCLSVTPDYYPAIIMKKRLSNILSKQCGK